MFFLNLNNTPPSKLCFSPNEVEYFLLTSFKQYPRIYAFNFKLYAQISSDRWFESTLISLLSYSALILEEIAIDCHNKETEQRLLQEAHDLHLSSLQLAKKAFGEFNVQTAKHYGNLGRLYQSMRKFKVEMCFSIFFFL